MLDPLTFFAQTFAGAATGRDSSDSAASATKRTDSTPLRGSRSDNLTAVGANSLLRSPVGKEEAPPAGLDLDGSPSTVRPMTARTVASATRATVHVAAGESRQLSGDQKGIG